MPLPDAIIAALQREAAKNAEAENALAAALMQNEHPGDGKLYLSLMLSERRKRVAAEHKLEEMYDALKNITEFCNHDVNQMQAIRRLSQIQSMARVALQDIASAKEEK